MACRKPPPKRWCSNIRNGSTTQIEVFDWLLERGDKKIAKNPAGFLVKAIQDNFAIPKSGFTSKAERQRKQEIKQRNERQAAEDRQVASSRLTARKSRRR